MKKKILAVVTAAVLALGCFATVCAEKELSETSYGKKANKWITEGKSDLNGVNWSANNDDFQIVGVDNADLYLIHLAAQYPKSKLIRVFEIKADDADIDNPIEITIADVDIKGNKNYAVYAFDTKTGEWSVSVAKIVSKKDGLIKFTVTKASILAICETNASNSSSSVVKTVEKDGQKVSPKTGEQ